MIDLSLIKKIDEYYNNVQKLGGGVPYSVKIIKLWAIISFIVYGTSFSEYFAYRFWEKSILQKKTYMTRRYMFKFFDKYNPTEYRCRIGDKSQSFKYYGELMHREQFDFSSGYNSFCDFCNKYNKIFIKKKIGWGGESALSIIVDTPDKISNAWKMINENFVVEPCISNCNEIDELYSCSLNTIKVTTLIINGKPEIQTALFRIGNHTNVDNMHLGGLGCGVDIVTGVVETPAYDKNFCQYEYHPITNKRIIGFQIPNWKEVLQLACSAALITPEMKYSSWDIAVTDNGPILIEGNWDAEFYAEQMIYNKGLRKKYIQMLEK